MNPAQELGTCRQAPGARGIGFRRFLNTLPTAPSNQADLTVYSRFYATSLLYTAARHTGLKDPAHFCVFSHGDCEVPGRWWG